MLSLNTKLGPVHVPIITLYLFISKGITMIATCMITYRILTVSRGRPSRYSYLVEILLENGIIYSAILFISSVSQVIQNAALGMLETTTYFTSILIPVTGIAPTLITARILDIREKYNDKWTHPASFMMFSVAKHDAGSTTLPNSDNYLTTKSTNMRSSDAEKGSL